MVHPRILEFIGSPCPVVPLLLAFLVAVGPAPGAKKGKRQPPSQLTLERIIGKDEFKAKGFAVRWLESGAAYTFLEKGEDGAAIWIDRSGRGEAEVLVAASELIPPDREEPLAVDGYSLSEDLSLVLIYTNAKRVWRRKSRGDYWVLDRSSHELRRLGGECKPSSLMFAKLSPDGTKAAYVRERNIYLEDLRDGSIRPLTQSSGANVFNGRFDWVYEEELGIRDGFRWSPDGTAIAYWQFDESGVRQQTLVDHVSGLYPKLTQFGYPKVGERNASVRIGVVELADGATRWMEIPGDPRNHYLARVEWMEDSQELVVQQLNRAQDTNKVMLVDRGGEVQRTLLTERDEAWVDLHNEMVPVRDGEAFTWISERDGWRHLYLVSRDGEEIRCLTPGEFDVIRLVRVDEASEWAYFLASPDNPAERYLYRVGLDGSGLERLTPAKRKRGTHSYSIAPNGTVAIATFSTFDDPPVTTLVSLPDHRRLEVLEKNKQLRRTVKALDRSPAEFFYVEIGEEVKLHARCLKPPDFDPSLSYPLLIYVYGEPAGQVVRDSWGGRTHLWHLMLAQHGYVVMSFDNRGTKAPRGRAWRRAAHRQIGILAPREQAAAVQAVLEQRPYLDAARVGSWGSSGGGSMTLNALFKYPGLYHTGIALASVPNQRGYDTIYQERYMGLPKDNVEGFREGSPINFAHQLEGNLLIVHGAQDDNCHYQGFEKLVDRLIRHNKQFTMMTYPRGTHAIKEGKNTTRHLYETMTRFLLQNLPPGGEVPDGEQDAP